LRLPVHMPASGGGPDPHPRICRLMGGLWCVPFRGGRWWS